MRALTSCETGYTYGRARIKRVDYNGISEALGGRVSGEKGPGEIPQDVLVLSMLRWDGRTKPVMNSLTAKYPSAVGV